MITSIFVRRRNIHFHVNHILSPFTESKCYHVVPWLLIWCDRFHYEHEEAGDRQYNLLKKVWTKSKLKWERHNFNSQEISRSDTRNRSDIPWPAPVTRTTRPSKRMSPMSAQIPYLGFGCAKKIFRMVQILDDQERQRSKFRTNFWRRSVTQNFVRATHTMFCVRWVAWPFHLFGVNTRGGTKL